MNTTSTPKKGLKMTKASHRLTSLLHQLGAGRRVRLDASKGLVRPRPSTPRMGLVRVGGLWVGGLFNLTTDESVPPSPPIIRPRRNHRALVALAAGLALASILVLPVAGAHAEELKPWWGVTAGERPTDLHSGPVQNAVEQLTIKAGAGEYALLEQSVAENGEYEKKNGEIDHSKAPYVPYGAKASVVQEALETIDPTNRVEVTGGPGDAGGTAPYTITFPGQGFCTPGQLTARKTIKNCVTPILALGEFPGFFGGTSLSGGSEGHSEAILTELFSGAMGANGEVFVDAQNRGDTGTSGTSAVTDTLPGGMRAVAIQGSAGNTDSEFQNGSGGPVKCVLKTLTCSFEAFERKNPVTEVMELVRPVLAAYEQIEVRIAVELQPGAASGEQNTATASGGGTARPVSASHALEVDGTEKFGVEDWQMTPENAGGSPDTQAGSHPFQLTNITTFNSGAPEREGNPQAVGTVKDVLGELPPGFIGNPTPFAQCTDDQFSKEPPGEVRGTFANECPATSAIGVATVTFNEPNSEHFATSTIPIFNMQPLPGEPARFAFKVLGLIPAFLDASVRTGGDYGVTITSSNIIQIASLLSVKLTFWGVPGDVRHDHQRGWECINDYGSCPTATNPSPPPFLVMPTSCEAPFQSTVHADSWGSSAGASQQAAPLTYDLPEAIDGCDHLPFSPSLEVSPDVPNASTATGLTVKVHVPQTAALNPEGLAESSVRGLSVTLPAGVALNPSGADGLQSCPLLTHTEPAKEAEEAEHKLVGVNLESKQPANCPNASKVATVTVRTPLLPNALNGFVYLATPAPNGELGLNPFNSLIALYFVVEDPVSGTLIKLPLRVTPNPVTGQLTATQAIPELPFEDAELHFFGGERAPLATPARCGSYTTSASFEPWSGNEPANALSSFQIAPGPNGSACPGQSLAFAPSLTGGTTNINAAAFSPLTTTITREDGQQDISSVKLHMPPGLSGILAHVALCGEAQANAGTCTSESEIGETIVSVGLGNDPFSVTGGKVYITGPYHGAPFGLSIVNPAVAGPFNLGQVIVRAKIEVDPHTAQLTITTNSESEGDAIPHIIDGIPLQIKHVNVTINRPGFTFNPTDCNPQQITGTISSDEGASSPVAVPFQVTNCASLKFAPKFTVSTSGKTSRAKGASLTAKLSEPNEPQGSQANITRVKVDLPKQLPSRLTTLQKACTNKQFELNPANCPKESKIGYAKVTTPLLPVPLEGTAIFVSHGGEAFPTLTMVLQGYGVTVDLVGTTFISKQGITSTTFKTVPDVPFNAFTLTLPEGKYSALAANGNLCKSKLAMPTEFLAQNGAKINESTKVSVSGCKKVKKSSKKKKGKKTNKRGKK